MIELPDDELDKLFKKSTEELDPTYEPGDWNALKRRLDQEDGRDTAAWIQKWYPLGILLLLTAVGIYFGMRNGSKLDTKKVATVSKSESLTKKGAERASELTISHAKDQGKNAPTDTRSQLNGLGIGSGGTDRWVSTRKSIDKAGLSKPIGEKPVFVEKNQPLVEERLATQSVEHQTIGKIHENDVHESEHRFVPVGKDQKLLTELPVQAAGGETLPGVTDGAERMTLSIEALKNLPLVKTKYMPLPEIGYNQASKEAKQEISRDISPKLAFRLGYSPDLSTVGLKDFSKPGTAVSILLEYAVKPRWYVQTGVVRSEKIYSARAGAYALNKYVTAINTPYSVDGTCSMVEIPLGVRYDFKQGIRGRIYGGVGVSSYYVQKEKYIYNYKEYVHGQAPGWKGKSGWFWLSHTTASLGYEHRISNKLSILAEPYILIPLKGVGYGKVNLVTSSIWFSVRYTPTFYKK